MTPEDRLQFKTILVATDLTHSGSCALRYAQKIARLHKSVLVVVHAIDPVGYAFPEGAPDSAAIDQAARDSLKEIEEETRQQGIPIHSVVETGIVCERILQAASDHHADLLVLGTRARTGIGRAALGTVARRLLAKATCPVLAVPPDADTQLVGHWQQVLAATDFSPASLSALHHAQRIAGRQLIVVHAANSAAQQEYDRSLERLRILAPTDESQSMPVERIVSQGNAGRVIVEQARNFQADLVVLGSPLNELEDKDFQTSTVLEVISNLKCAVLCVPAMQTAPEPEIAKELAFLS
jgi:nucleotide-binding universal stress UspA family protein